MHRQLYIALLRFLLIFGMVFPALAQNYPVQVNVISAANALNYASFFADQNNHLTLAITLTDFNSDPIPVRLRLRFSGPATFYTNPSLVVGQTIVLEPGMTEIVQGIDLAPYLQSSNLIKEPFNLNLNKLPSGYYTVCAEVIRDGVNAEVLSTSNCGMFSIADVQPPFLQFPTCENALDTGQIFYPFNWTPAPNYFPVMGAELQYTFSLYNWFDPNNFSALQAAPFLIDEQITSVNTVQVSEWDLPGGFQVGEKYLWRVRAQVLENGMDLAMIENNGFSQWCTFTYGEPITLQDVLTDGLYIDLTASGAGERKGQAQWTVIDNTPSVGLSTFSQFILEYRKKPIPGESFVPEWFVDTLVSVNNDFIYQLAPNTTYQVRIAGMSGTFVSERTDIVEFTTSPEREYQCGDQDLPPPPLSDELENAMVGIEVQIGQFYMTTTELFPTGSPGHYRGKGTIPIAFLLGARAKVRFDDILINTEYVVREGTVEVMTDGVDDWLHDQYMQFIDPIYVDDIVSGITIDSASGSGWYIVDGQQINFTFNPPDYPIIVNDANGNSYTIWPNGDIDTSSYFNISEEWGVSASDVVIFSQAQNEVAGFDGKQFVAWHENYEIMELADSSKYFVANKSLRTGQGDNVALSLPSSAGQVSFGYENGPSGPAIPSISSSGTVSLPAFPNKENYELYAYNASGAKIGKLNLFVYDAKQREVVIVPIANATIDETALETYLDATLGEANLDIDVTVAPQWNDSVFIATSTISLPGEVGLLNKYSDEMRALGDAYFSDTANTQNNDAYYVFVVAGFDEPSELGYMVRGRGMGFVKAGSDYVTYAHELGHGMGALQHSWMNNGPAQGRTANLMDYSDSLNPDNLIKAQWKELRDVDVMPSLWDEVEDGSSLGLENGDIASYWRNSDESVCFLAPNNQVIRLNKFVQKAYFSLGISEIESELFFPSGILMRFEIHDLAQAVNGQPLISSYAADIVNGIFKGYKNTVSGQYYQDYQTAVPTDYGITLQLGGASMKGYFFDAPAYSYLQANTTYADSIITVHSLNSAKFKGDPLIELAEYPYGFGVFGYTSDKINTSLTDPLYYVWDTDINVQLPLVSKIVELRMSYPDLYNRMSCGRVFGRWAIEPISNTIATIINSSQYGNLVPEEFILLTTDPILKGYFDYRFIEYNYAQYDYNKQVELFLHDFTQLIVINRQLNAGTISSFQDACTNSGHVLFTPNRPSTETILKAVEAMNNDEIAGLCIDVKTRLIGILLNPTIGAATNDYERAIWKIMKVTPEQEKMALISSLCDKKYGGELIIKQLADAVDNQVMGFGDDDYFKLITNYIIKAFAGSSHAYSNLNVGSMSAAQIIELRDRYIPYHYEGFVSRLFSLSPLLGGEVDIISEVSINSATKKLSFKNNATTAFINVGSTPTKVLGLLDPVIITDNARLIDVYTNETDGYFAPACILYFYEQAAVDRTTVEAIETAVDVLSLAVPGGQGKLIFKVLNYADKLSSVANIASNYNEQTNPELANALALTSGILGLVDLGASFSGVKNIATSANKTSDAIQLINKSENALTINHGDRVTALVNKLNQGTDPDVIATMSSVKAREFVEELLEMERSAAQKIGKTDVVEDLDDALDVVRGSIGVDWMGVTLMNKLDGLGNAQLKQQFIADFADASSQTKALLNQDVDLVESWKVVNYTELGTDINALQKIHTYIEEGVDVNLFKTDMDDILSTGSQSLKNDWLNTLGNDNYILLRRGTDRYAEISAFDQSGYVLSDAARAKYLETGDIQQALTYADDIHQQWLMIFNGDINAYAQAHASLGTAMESTYNLPRTLISFTSDNTQLDNFVSTGGTRFIGIFEKSNVTQQTLSTSSESEYLITSGLQIFEIQ